MEIVDTNTNLPNETRFHETKGKRKKFDSAAWVLIPFNEVLFDDTKIDSETRLSTRRNNNLIFDVDSAS